MIAVHHPNNARATVLWMSFRIEAAAQRAGVAARPRLRALLERIHARPAYRRALERGGLFEWLRRGGRTSG